MKALNDLYTEVIASDALKAEFMALKTPEDIVAFAKKNGCETTLEDIKAFFEEKQKASGELSEDELEQVAGGKSASWEEALYSTVTLGMWCLIKFHESSVDGASGSDIKGKGMLCTWSHNGDSKWA